MLRGLNNFSLPGLEKKVLDFWRTNKIFEKSLERTKRGKEYVFYEGPPTANGRPGIHHVLARVFKDIILRYKTMCGFHVPRRGGWDTHGLPVELEVEKQLGLKSKKEIEKFGIAEFNRRCKESVWKYKDEWEKMTERIGFWLDLEHPYITYENSYIETLWWTVKQIWDKKLLYKGHKVVPWCTRCGTVLSSHELALGYKEVEENSVYLKFKLKPDQKIGNFKTNNKTYILSWTTTPWTLPGNVALAVREKIEYSVAEKNGETLIFASESPIGKEFGRAEIRVKGNALIGLEYKPLFDIPSLKSKTAYKIYDAKFVTTEEGTGVVHTAVMYGEDDYELGKKVGLPQHHVVDEQGKFTKDVQEFEGLYTKSPETEKKILKILDKNGNLLRTELYVHEYPFCWRCDTPLIYYARDSWFIGMSKLRKQLLRENEKINWIPKSVKNGRFGEWLKEAKDWAFSRERYWGMPLPIWKCAKCGAMHGVGGVDELEEFSGKPKNRYFVMRHGLSENITKDVLCSWPEKKKMHLTTMGMEGVRNAATKLKSENIDIIFSSDLTRAKETIAEIARLTGIKNVHFDPRLREVDFGDLNGMPGETYHEYYRSEMEKFTKPMPRGETITDVRARAFDLIREIERTHRGKTVLIVSHEHLVWVLESAMRGWSNEETIQHKHNPDGDFISPAEFQEVPLRMLPRDETGKMDLHRPYVDEIVFPCKKCGGEMKRIPEVADVWFDSGAMPFAQTHYPFSKEDKLEFPADYISEGIDQTRGWFYTLLAVGVLLGRGTPYKNVISLGLVLDKNGQKMSKSKGNIVDPWTMIEKYGADVLRWYFYTVNPPGEPKRFDEIELQKTLRRFVLLLYNSFAFFETYSKKNLKIPASAPRGVHALDKWILARLNDTASQSTKYLERYEVGDAARTIERFVDDLSRWYIRRSRRRFQKPEDQKDYLSASQTLGFVLRETSKFIAPFTPFLAEGLYKSLVSNGSASVHLEAWPKAAAFDKKILGSMGEIRRLASTVLAKRAEAGIKVRQPLRELRIRSSELGKQKDLLQILRDEVNVKEIAVDGKMKEEIQLDTEITHELKEEGWLRGLIRMVQDMRQDAKLEPKDKIILHLQLPAELLHVLEKNEIFFKKEVNAKVIDYRRTGKFDIELETKFEEWPVWIGIKKKP